MTTLRQDRISHLSASFEYWLRHYTHVSLSHSSRIKSIMDLTRGKIVCDCDEPHCDSRSQKGEGSCTKARSPERENSVLPTPFGEEGIRKGSATRPNFLKVSFFYFISQQIMHFMSIINHLHKSFLLNALAWHRIWFFFVSWNLVPSWFQSLHTGRFEPLPTIQAECFFQSVHVRHCHVKAMTFFCHGFNRTSSSIIFLCVRLF